jgi:hypothetical protein
MSHRRAILTAAVVAALPLLAQDTKWGIHDLNRPMAPVVDPGGAGKPPSDAIVLFDGKDLSQWVSDKGDAPAPWKVENGYMEVVKGTGGIHTKQGFGDAQLHIEWMAPKPAVGESQDRGNSGVFFMGRYEVQVLDSYQSKTYTDGQASALYGQYPPMVNAARPPGEWQTYDLVIERPRFRADGMVQKPARVTVFLNGVVVQHGETLSGPTGHKSRPPYAPHADKLPIGLQDHSHPVRFRNIWIRELTLERP